VLATTLYLAISDPQLLERRIHVGPRAETERAQKIICLICGHEAEIARAVQRIEMERERLRRI
jgi:hypothetical protein